MTANVQDFLEFSSVQPSQSYTVEQWREGQVGVVEDALAEEVPIAMVYNGISHAVMLATPQDLEDFALGFSLTEGILSCADELYDVEVDVQPNGVMLKMHIATARFVALKERRRSLAGRTGCGLCGTESLNDVFRLPAQPRLIQTKQIQVASEALLRAHRDMRERQPLQAVTGATHACAWADEAGNIELIREDVGRHNALDKLIGALNRRATQGGFILTTSRASYEMVQKVLMAGFEILSAISAPTGLAVRLADFYQLTLLGFVRERQFVVYTHPARVTHNDVLVKVKSE